MFEANRLSTYIFFMANGLFYGCWTARIPVFAETFDLGEAMLALLFFNMACGAATSMLASPILLRRFGSLRLARALGLVMGFGFLGLIMATGSLGIAAALFLMGFGGGGMDIAMNAYGSKVERAAGISLMSGFHGSWSLGTTIGGLSAFLTISAGLSTAVHFAIMWGMIIALAFCFDRAKPFDTAATTEAPFRALKELLKFGPIRIICAIALLSFVAEGLVMDWGGLLFVDALTASESQAALAVTVFTGCMMVARLLGDRVINSFGPRQSFLAALSVAILGMVILLASAAPWGGYAGLALMGIGLSVLVPIAFSTAPLLAKDREEEAIALVGMIAYFGLLSGPVLIGFVAELISLKTSFALFGVFFVIALTANKVLKRKF
ncbi:MAG: MFS transporter [Pseudomonadota bacterium]